MYTAKNNDVGVASFGDTEEEAMWSMAEALELELKTQYLYDEITEDE